jgi:hypothetical protein
MIAEEIRISPIKFLYYLARFFEVKSHLSFSPPSPSSKVLALTNFFLHSSI